MKVAHVFSASGHIASYKLGKMILPQLEDGRHGVEVVGMMLFDDVPRRLQLSAGVLAPKRILSAIHEVVHRCPRLCFCGGVNIGVR
jgi:hypothetical protein